MQTRRSNQTSRRDLHRTSATRQQGPWGKVLSLMPKAALVGALGAATIAVPIAHAADDYQGHAVGGADRATLPTAFEVLSDRAPAVTQTTLLAAPTGRVTEVAASRSLGREPLPGCHGEARSGGSNGEVPESNLCTLWDNHNRLRGDAAVAMSALNDSFRVAFGRDLCITDSYRTLAEQYVLARTKPGLAATPGKSNHGWGLAVDFCGWVYNEADVKAWLADNGPSFGWINPEWAKRSKYEPWHYEFSPGTSQMGSNWDER